MKYIPLLIAITLTQGCSYFASEHVTITAKIVDAERACSGSKDGMSCKYLVYTDKETFRNTDVLFEGKFNSADIQGKIKANINKTCTFEVYGWRIGIISMMRNIKSVKDCHTPTTRGQNEEHS